MKRLEFWAFLLFCLFRVRKMMTKQAGILLRFI